MAGRDADKLPDGPIVARLGMRRDRLLTARSGLLYRSRSHLIAALSPDFSWSMYLFRGNDKPYGTAACFCSAMAL